MRNTLLVLWLFTGIVMTASMGLAGEGQQLTDVIENLETLIDQIGTTEASIQENIRQLAEEEAALQERIDEETAPKPLWRFNDNGWKSNSGRRALNKNRRRSSYCSENKGEIEQNQRKSRSFF